MHLGFGLGELLEDAFCESLCALVKCAALDHRSDMVQVPVFVLGLVLHGDLRGTETLFLDLSAQKAAAWKTERVDAGLDRCEIGAGVNKGAERHFAADSARTVEIRNRHGLLASERFKWIVRK